jgi:colicin import membrane protein
VNAQSPGAYTASVVLHGGVILIVLMFTYANGVEKDEPKVFELVAGAGDNYGATAAPALGSVGGIKVAPSVDRSTPAPAQAAPRPKAAPSPIQPAPEAAPAPARTKRTPDLVADLKRVEARREARLEAKYQKQLEAEQKRLAQEASKVTHIDAEGIREGVIGGSTDNKTGGAGGRALTREEGSLLDAYFALLKARIKENHEPPEGVSDTLVARVEFLVAADGSLSDVRIAKSSGSADFDRSVVEACERTQSIGARPDGRSETVEMTFKMREDEAP